MDHFTEKDIRNYVKPGLGEEMLLMMDEHLADCEDCCMRVRKARMLQFAWKTLSAKAHGEVYWQAQIERALTQLAESSDCSSYRERIKAWITHWQNKAEAVVGLVFERSTQEVQVITQGWEALTRPDSELGFAFAKLPIRGEEKGCITVEALGLQNTEFTIDIDSEQGTVTVRIRKIPSGRTPPLVVLIPASKKDKPLHSDPKQPAGSKQYIAQFTNVPSGKYLLIFEPIGERN